jgi:hypothetical protein
MSSPYLDGYSYGSAVPSLHAQRSMPNAPSRATTDRWISEFVAAKMAAERYWAAAYSCPDGAEQDQWMVKAASAELTAKELDRKISAPYRRY